MLIQADRNSFRTYTQVLSRGKFRYLWFAQICSQLAINIFVFVQALHIYEATRSNTAVSFVFLAFGIPSVLIGLMAGTFVDYLDKRKVLFVCDIVRAGLILLLIPFGTNLGMVYAVIFLSSIVTQFYVPSEAPLIPTLVPPRDLVTANSLFSFTYYASMGIGFILSGPLLRLLGDDGTSAVIVLLLAAAATSVFQLPRAGFIPDMWARVRSVSILYYVRRTIAEMYRAVEYVRRSDQVRDALLLLTGTQIILSLLGSLGPGFADRMLNIDVRDASLAILGPSILGILTGALWTGSFGTRFGTHRLITVGIFAAGSLLTALAVSVRLYNLDLPLFREQWFIFPVVILTLFFLGFANSFLDVPSNSILQRESDADVRSRVYGLLTACVGGIGILPVVAGGIVADTFGLGKTIFILGILILLYGSWRVSTRRQ